MCSCIPEPAQSPIAETLQGKASTRTALTKVMHQHLVYIHPVPHLQSWIQGSSSGKQKGHMSRWGDTFCSAALLLEEGNDAAPGCTDCWHAGAQGMIMISLLHFPGLLLI